MAAPPRRGLARLVSTDGHSHWAEPVMWHDATPPPQGFGGYLMGIECSFGGVPLVHYIARNEMGAAYWRCWPYTFASIAEAEAARDELAAQQNEGE